MIIAQIDVKMLSQTSLECWANTKRKVDLKVYSDAESTEYNQEILFWYSWGTNPLGLFVTRTQPSPFWLKHILLIGINP